jgi:hypothetical protein
MIYTIEIEGRGIVAVDNPSIIEDEHFKNGLRMFRSDGEALWDGQSELSIRKASLDEKERWRLAQDEDHASTLCLLVDIDADTIPQ